MGAIGLANFVETLPPQLRIAVSIHIYKKTFNTHPFFRGLSNRRLLSYMGSHFRPKFYQPGEYLYRQGDEITSFNFIKRGIGAFVKPAYQN
jgi:hypothetical protein